MALELVEDYIPAVLGKIAIENKFSSYKECITNKEIVFSSPLFSLIENNPELENYFPKEDPKKERNYQMALKLLSKEDDDSKEIAKDLLEELGSYKDSKLLLENINKVVQEEAVQNVVEQEPVVDEPELKEEPIVEPTSQETIKFVQDETKEAVHLSEEDIYKEALERTRKIANKNALMALGTGLLFAILLVILLILLMVMVNDSPSHLLRSNSFCTIVTFIAIAFHVTSIILIIVGLNKYNKGKNDKPELQESQVLKKNFKASIILFVAFLILGFAIMSLMMTGIIS